MNDQNNASDETQKTENVNTDVNQEKLANEQAEENRLKNIEKLRALPVQKVLSQKQQEILLSIKEEELTDDDNKRIAWLGLRIQHHKYKGTSHTTKQKKKLKAKRRQSNKSRKANR